MLLKDKKSGFRFVYFIKHKNEALSCFKKFYNYVVVQQKRKIVNFRTDNGLEFCNREFRQFLDEVGIKSCTSAPYCPQQNERIERENRTVKESARSMLNAKDLPRFLWAEAVNIAVYALELHLAIIKRLLHTRYGIERDQMLSTCIHLEREHLY